MLYIDKIVKKYKENVFFLKLPTSGKWEVRIESNNISPFLSLLNSTSDKPSALNPLTFNYEHTRNCIKFIRD